MTYGRVVILPPSVLMVTTRVPCGNVSDGDSGEVNHNTYSYTGITYNNTRYNLSIHIPIMYAFCSRGVHGGIEEC